MTRKSFLSIGTALLSRGDLLGQGQVSGETKLINCLHSRLHLIRTRTKDLEMIFRKDRGAMTRKSFLSIEKLRDAQMTLGSKGAKWGGINERQSCGASSFGFLAMSWYILLKFRFTSLMRIDQKAGSGVLDITVVYLLYPSHSLKKSSPLSSTTIKAGKFSTSICQTASMPIQRKTNNIIRRTGVIR